MAKTTLLKNETENVAGQDADRDRRAKELVLDTIRTAQDGRTYHENKWAVCDRLWRGDPISRYFPAERNTHVPEPYKAERAATPRVKMALVPSDDFYRIIPKRKGGVKPQHSKALMDEQLRHGKFDARFTRFIQSCAKYGTAIAKVPFVFDRLKVTSAETRDEFIYQDGQVVGTKVVRRGPKEEEVNRDRSELVNLSLLDVYFDWRYEDIQQAPFIVDETKQTKEYCLRRLAEGIYTNITREDILMMGKAAPLPEPDGKDLKQQASGADMMKVKGEDAITVSDGWGLFDMNDTGERVQCQLTLLNRKYVVRIKTNNFWHGYRPYLQDVWTPVEGQAYGIGVIEPIVRMTLDLNDLQNSINASAALNVNPMVKAGDKFMIPDVQFEVSPGRVLRGEDITQLQPFLMPSNNKEAREAMEITRRNIEETTGLPRLFQGAEGAASETATSFAGRRREANLRLRDKILYTAENVLQPFLEMMVYNNQQFLDEDRVVRVTGDAQSYLEFTVTPGELASIARVEVILPPQIELLGVRGQMMQAWLQPLMQNLQMASALGIDVKEMAKGSWLDQFGYRKADLYFPPTDQDVDPQDIENLVMMRGEVVDVQPWHPHGAHAQELVEFTSSPFYETLPDKIQAIFEAHFANHLKYLQQAVERTPLGPGPMGAGPQGAQPTLPPPAPLEGVEQGRPLAQEQRQGVQGT